MPAEGSRRLRLDHFSCRMLPVFRQYCLLSVTNTSMPHSGKEGVIRWASKCSAQTLSGRQSVAPQSTKPVLRQTRLSREMRHACWQQVGIQTSAYICGQDPAQYAHIVSHAHTPPLHILSCNITQTPHMRSPSTQQETQIVFLCPTA